MKDIISSSEVEKVPEEETESSVVYPTLQSLSSAVAWEDTRGVQLFCQISRDILQLPSAYWVLPKKTCWLESCAGSERALLPLLEWRTLCV